MMSSLLLKLLRTNWRSSNYFLLSFYPSLKTIIDFCYFTCRILVRTSNYDNKMILDSFLCFEECCIDIVSISYLNIIDDFLFLKLPNTIIIGYAQTFEEAYEALSNLYREEEEGVPHENPPVEDFLVWRDLRVFDGKVTSPCFCSIVISMTLY